MPETGGPGEIAKSEAVKFTRRDVLKISAAFASRGLFRRLAADTSPILSVLPNPNTRPNNQRRASSAIDSNKTTDERTEQKPQILLDKVGMHTIAQIIETQEQMDVTFADADYLGMKSLTAIQPSVEFLRRAKERGITVIARINLKENNYHDHTNPDPLQVVLDNFQEAGLSPIIQVGNEIDIEKMTNPTSGLPEIDDVGDYIRSHFLPAFEKVKNSGGRLLTVPLSAKDPLNTADYNANLEKYKVMAQVIEASIPKEDRDKHLALGIHAYEFRDGQNPLEYVRQVRDIFQNTCHTNFPIYVTETGVSENVKIYTKDEVAAMTETLLQQPIPADLNIVAWNLWVHGGSGIRNMDPAVKDEEWAKKDDAVALREDYLHVNPVYNRIRGLKERLKSFGGKWKKDRQAA